MEFLLKFPRKIFRKLLDNFFVKISPIFFSKAPWRTLYFYMILELFLISLRISEKSFEIFVWHSRSSFENSCQNFVGVPRRISSSIRITLGIYSRFLSEFSIILSGVSSQALFVYGFLLEFLQKIIRKFQDFLHDFLLGVHREVFASIFISGIHPEVYLKIHSVVASDNASGAYFRMSSEVVVGDPPGFYSGFFFLEFHREFT